jgi:hypothetical protein
MATNYSSQGRSESGLRLGLSPWALGALPLRLLRSTQLVTALDDRIDEVGSKGIGAPAVICTDR